MEGESMHEDSAGHEGIIREGGVQWMCAVRPFFIPVLRASHNLTSSRVAEVSIRQYIRNAAQLIDFLGSHPC